MSKFAIILSTESLANLANHNDKQDVNASHAYHRDRLRDQLNKTDQNVFFLISQHSVKYFGVSYMSNATMGKKLECSPRTVQRSIAKLSKLGAIEVFAARRKTGDKRQTANVLRLVRRPAEDCRAECHTKSDTPIDSLLNPYTNKDLKTIESAGARELVNNSSDEVVVSPQEALEAFGVSPALRRSLLPLALPADKILTLVNPQDTRNIVNHVQHALMADFPKVAANFELDKYVDVIASAAVRTAWMAKRKHVRNIVGYFLKTLVNSLRKAFMAMTVDCLADYAVEELGEIAYESLDVPYFAEYLSDVAAAWVDAELVKTTVNGVLDALQNDLIAV